MASASPPATDSAVVELAGVVKHYGAVKAVDGVDLAVRRGEIFGLIGHNGAGKSTLFKTMLGLVAPTAGSVRIDGESVTGGGFRKVRAGIGYLPENVVLYDNLSGLETLAFFARLKRARRDGCMAALERTGLAHAAHRPVREYSKGMRQRLGFAQALLGTPKLLFLDEPTNGLDPQAIRAFYATLRELQAQGVTVFITSHILSEIQERVDRLAIMVGGRIEALGSVQALREQLDIPLGFTLAPAPGRLGEVCAALAPLPGVDVDAADGLVQVRCPRDAKMAVVAALGALGADALADLQLHEPSLEDVFFGLGT